MAVRMQQRRGTYQQWYDANPLLTAGEIAYETDTGKFKIGDNSTLWRSLPYFVNEDTLQTSLGDYVLVEDLAVANGVATLDENGKLTSSQIPNIDELSQDAVDAVLVAGTGINKTYNDNANTLTLEVDTSVIATKAELAEVAQDSVNDVLVAGTGITKSYDDNANTLTVSVDTSVIATKAELDEVAQDSINDALVAGTGLDKTYNDNLNTITLDIDSSVTTNSGIQTLTNKTISFANNTISGTVAEFNSALSDDDFATLSNTVTLSNKSIDLATNTVTGSLAEFNSALQDASFATIDGAETLTNKTISYADNTITVNVSNISDLTASAAEINTLDGITASTEEINILDGATLTTTELNYVDGVTSSIQTQIDGKASLSGATFTGSVEIDQNLTVDGNLTVNGTTFSASSTSIIIEDNLVQLAHNNSVNTVDLGIVVGYNDGSAKHAGIVRDVSADKWKLFKGVTTEPTTTVDFTQGSLDTLAVQAIELTDALSPIYGGTGLTSYATGDIIYASAADTLNKLSAGTEGYLLTMSSGVPVWAAAPVSLPSQTGNEGKYLTTDGSTASWATVAAGGGADEIKILMGAL